jgi:mannosyltransferase
MARDLLSVMGPTHSWRTPSWLPDMQPLLTATKAVPVRPHDATASPAAVLVLVVAFSAALRLHHLNRQLWLDEVSALTGFVRRPLSAILLDWSPTSHALFDLLAHISILVFGESPAALRLPAAVFGVLGVVAFHMLATRLLASRHALFLTALFALSYHHIFYSQNARGYTALIFLYLLASVLLLDFRATGRIRAGAGVAYVAAVWLTAYANVVGTVVLPAHLLLVLALHWRRGRDARPPFPVGRYLRFAAPAALGIAVLYLPFVRSVLEYVQSNAEIAASGPRPGAGLVLEVIEGFSAAFPHPLVLAAAAGVGSAGLVILVRRHAFAAATLIVPLALQVLVIFSSGVGIHPRYFAMALPLVYIVGGFGLLWVVSGIVRVVPPGHRRRAEIVVLAGLIAVSAVPLRGYYSMPKQDFLGAIEMVDQLAGDGDARVAVHLAGSVIEGYYGAGFADVRSVTGLQDQERAASRVWVVATLERLLRAEHPELHEYLRTYYRQVHVLPGSLGDGAMRIYERSH